MGIHIESTARDSEMYDSIKQATETFLDELKYAYEDKAKYAEMAVENDKAFHDLNRLIKFCKEQFRLFDDMLTAADQPVSSEYAIGQMTAYGNILEFMGIM